MNPLPHAMTRYAAVTERLVDKCQQDYHAGQDLSRSAPSLSAGQVAIVVAETLEADGLLSLPLEKLMTHARRGDVSDWSLAVLAEIFRAQVEDVDSQQDIFAQARRDELHELAWLALEKTLDSPTASPALWYEQIFFDTAQQYRLTRQPHAIELLKRGLAHNLHFSGGNNAINFLRDLAETHLALDQLTAGLNLYAGLLRHNPADIWTYNAIAIRFDQFGLADLGEAATRRGLELLQSAGDPHGLHNQLTDSLAEMQTSELRGREAEADPAAVAALRDALGLDFVAGQPLPLPELCRRLVPGFDRLPLKTAKVGTVKAAPKPGRNEPCWCGSGKKYKQCHLAADLQNKPV